MFNKLFSLFAMALITMSVMAKDFTDVQMSVSGMSVTMNNGKTFVSINSKGQVSSMKYNGTTELLGSTGIYFDFTTDNGNQNLNPVKMEVIKQTAEMCEVLYSATSGNTIFQQGYIMRNNVAGVYTYVIATGTATSANEPLKEVRVCTRLASNQLYGYVDDRMTGKMPTNSEMEIAEQNQIQDATYYLQDGSIYTKYNWANYIERDLFHGTSSKPLDQTGYGVFNIPVSYEWINGGPDRQELMVHATSKSPITIQMLQGEHLGGSALVLNEGEKKLYGPFLIHAVYSTKPLVSAKQTAEQQQKEWPFQWFDNELYPKERATVSGHLNVTTGQRNDSVRVVLAQEEDKELITQTHGYQFWTTTDANGDFIIKNVRPGAYTLYAYAQAGEVTDELQVKNITVEAGEQSLGTIDWTPVKYSQMLWMLGENNRRSSEFKLCDEVRQYGLWDAVPATTTLNIGTDDPAEKWYYAQTKAGTWTVKFNLEEKPAGTACVTASLAGATNANASVAVKVNGYTVGTWKPGINDAAIYRSAINSGRHWLFSNKFSASYLKKGDNTLTLTMSGNGKNGGFMYDCLKLEAGDIIVNAITTPTAKPSKDCGKCYNLAGQQVTADYKGMIIRGGKKISAR